MPIAALVAVTLGSLVAAAVTVVYALAHR